MDLLTAPAATAPNGYHEGVIFAHRYEWVELPWPDDLGEGEERDPDDVRVKYAGFAARILKNPMGGEEVAERQAWIDLLNRAITEDAYLESIAWRVKAWNALSGDEDGNVVPIPAPGEMPGNWQAFRAIPSDLCAWLVNEVRTANHPKSRTTPNSPPAGTTDGPPQPREGPPAPETE